MTDRIDLVRFQRAITTTANGTVVTGITAGANGSTSQLVLDSAGNVGIGTSSPVYRLTTVGGALQLSPGTTAQEGIRIQRITGAVTFSGINLDNNAFNALAFFTGASEAMRIDTSSNLQFNSGYGSVATAFGCRAWVSFNGTGTVAIRGSGNVSSITDNAVGDYTVNFATAMPDINYSAPTSFSGENGARMSQTDIVAATGVASARTTTTFRLSTGVHGVSSNDCAFVNVAIFR